MIEYKKQTKKELVKYCKDNNIEIKSSYKKSKLIELIEKFNQTITDSTDETIDEIVTNKAEIKTNQIINDIANDNNELDISDIELLKRGLSNYDLTEEDITHILDIHQDYMNEFCESLSNNGGSSPTSKKWMINKIEFKNVLIYGGDIMNTINFINYDNGIVGILGNNAIGKSSIINIILYALFDTLGTNFNNINIVNNNQKTFSINIYFSSGKDKYIIQKNGKNYKNKKAKRESTKKSIDFSVDDIIENSETFNDANKDKITCKVDMTLFKNGIEVSTNKKVIEDEVVKIIGTYEDFVLTNIFSNTINFNLMTMTPSNVISKLNSLFKLDNYSLIHKNIKAKLKTINQDVKYLQGELHILQQDLGRSTEQINEINFDSFDNELNSVNNTLNNNENNNLSNIQDKYDAMIGLFNKYNKYEKEIINQKSSIINRLKNYKDEIKSSKKQIKKLKINNTTDDHISINGVNIDELKEEDIKKYKKDIKNKYKDKSFNLLSLETKLQIILEKIDKNYNIQQIEDEIIDKKSSADINIINEVENNSLISTDIIDKDIYKLEQLKEEYYIDNYNEYKTTDDELIKKVSQIITIKGLKKMFKPLGIYYDDIDSKNNDKDKNLNIINKKKKRIKKLKKMSCIPDDTIQDVLKNLEDKLNEKNNDNNKITLDDKIVKNAIKILKDVNTIQNKSDLINKHNDKILKLEEINRKINSNIEYNKRMESNVILLKHADILKVNMTKQRDYLYLNEQLDLHKKSSTLTKKINHTKAINIITLYDNREKIRTLLNKIEELENKITSTETEKDKITDKLHTLQTRKQQIQFIMETANKLLENTDKLKKSISRNETKINQYEYVTKILTIYMDLVHIKNIPMVLLKLKLRNIQNNINNFLSNLVNFKMEIVESKGKIIFNIIKNNKLLSFVQCSSFERFIIQVAVKRALTTYSYINKNTFFIIDEGMDCIDSNNWEKLPILIDNLQQQYSHIFLISHNDKVKKLINKAITINHINNISKIE